MLYSNLEEIIKNICKYEYSYFLDKENVVGVGCGYKSVRNISTSEVCIQVFVKKKIPCHLLNKDSVIPDMYKGIRTDVIETGIFMASSLRGRVRPVTGGYCIGPEDVDVTGTYGGLVADERFVYMLSNNHVIAGNNPSLIGNPILQPSEEYGGHFPQDIVAYVSKFIPIKFITRTDRPINHIDAAIGTVANKVLFSRDTTYIGSPKGVANPVLGMKVQMVGSTSEYLSGMITSISATVMVNFGGSLEALFADQILSTPANEEGDSGAFLFDFNRKVVGLVFGISGIYTISNKITEVLDALNVKLVTD